MCSVHRSILLNFNKIFVINVLNTIKLKKCLIMHLFGFSKCIICHILHDIFAHCYYLEYKERYIGIESKKKKYDR